MKVTKIPGLGSYGAIIDDFDWTDPGSYRELKNINIDSLVTVVRGQGVDHFDHLAKNLSQITEIRPLGSKWALRNGPGWRDMLTPVELEISQVTKNWPIQGYPGWMKVTAEKDSKGNPLGVFGDTDILWHTDEPSVDTFNPLVVLYGMKGMVGSATSFTQTADWYEAQTDSFRSELNELVSVFKWDNQKVQPGSDRINEEIVRSNFAPVDGLTLPLVNLAANGVPGIRYSDLITGFQGVSDRDFQRITDKIRSEIFDEKYVYDYWWEHDCGDLLLFDQSITLHCRKIQPGLDMKTVLDRRVAYRTAGDYAGMLDYNPYLNQHYANVRLAKMNSLKDFK